MKKLLIDNLEQENDQSETIASLEKMLTDAPQSIELKEVSLSDELDKKIGVQNIISSKEGVKLKDRLAMPVNMIDYTENPFNTFHKPVVETFCTDVQKSSFIHINKRVSKSTNKRNLIVLSLCVFLLSSSIMLNSFFIKTIDPIVVSVVSMPYKITAGVASLMNKLFYNFAVKPYVVTVGEYGNLAVAKDAAVSLLPRFKQINIIELDSGFYTFEIQRFASKSEAYKTAKRFLKEDLDTVHVRYMRTK